MSSKQYCAPFAYRCLPETSRAFRLLQLLPGHEESRIEVELLNSDLKRPPTFEALSYAWGDSRDRVKIFCQNKPLLVTRNLAAALRELRGQSVFQRRLPLWIDAICINQDDVREKNHQVAMMKDIYSAAKRVIVWLGEADSSTPLILEFLNVAQSQLKREAQEEKKRKSFVRRMSKSFPLRQLLEDSEVNTQKESETGKITTLKGLAHIMNIPPPSLEHILLRFLQRDWFHRAWVVQEFALATQLEMRLGNHKLDIEVVSQIARRDLGVGPLVLEGASVENLRTVREKYCEDGYIWSASALVNLTHTRKCVDPRDKIYSILGLCPPAVAIAIEPDYSKPVEEVYTDFASACLNSDCGLTILAYCCLPPDGPANGLPSWVPDWRLQKEKGKIGWLRGRSASEGTAKRLKVTAAKELHLRGNILDRVAEICPSRCERSAGYPTVEMAASLIHSWITFALRDIGQWYNPTSEPMLEAFVRTLATDYGQTYDSQGRSVSIILTNSGIAQMVGMLNLLHERLPIRGYPSALNLGHKYGFDPSLFDDIVDTVAMWNWGRSIFTTDRGYIGVGPPNLREDDVVCILYGSHVPHILRQQGQSDQYLHVGDSYVHGVMSGEAVKSWDAVDIVLV